MCININFWEVKYADIQVLLSRGSDSVALEWDTVAFLNTPRDSGASGAWITLWETMVRVSDYEKRRNVSLKYNKYWFLFNTLKYVLKNTEKLGRLNITGSIFYSIASLFVKK